MPKLVWFNGTVSPLETASVPAMDHAHLYGDGIFEGIRIYDRKVFKLDQHLDRLFHGANFLGFDVPHTKAELRAIVLDVCAQANLDAGYIRLNVTRGSGLGLNPKAVETRANVMVAISSLALYPAEAYDTGLDVITSSIRVITSDALDPRLKCIGRYASNIMAKGEANRAGAGEALMLNAQGHVAECTGDNIFIFSNGVLKTPHSSCGILRGITRDTVLQLAREAGIPTEETILSLFDIVEADEAFLTGTAAEVIPMVRLDHRPIGDGKPGPRTVDMIARFRAHTATGVPFGTLVAA
ncbi:MAG: branched-chain-amino-acid transaminase [Fimbriimonadaceae bacterium]|nr:branched-chain-amino-acid transaminase [Fimbriimonadaceae bacterium]